MEVKKLIFILFLFSGTMLLAQNKKVSETVASRNQKKAEKRERINQLIKQEEEGALIYNKQSAFGIKFNTDGWGLFYERGKYKTITKTNLWWMEFGERKHIKEERVPTISASQGFIIISSYIYGKQNNFYYFKAGVGQQKLIGGKGNKNGVAVSAIYGAGITAGLLKPYYLEIQNPTTGLRESIKYSPANENLFLDPNIILGKGGLSKGLGETKFVPGGHARVALRFDYGRYNEMLSAIEIGLNAEFYSQKMPIVLLNKEKNFFFNAYAAITFGRRK
ncbi:MAG: hypothetical protein FD183_355 [Chitinophagaceae bacterium]|nr:MAG: hypothetical protein FD183_355 [Chitinophagaceae bacterium]